MLDFGILDVGSCMLDLGFWILVFRFWILDFANEIAPGMSRKGNILKYARYRYT